MRLKRTIHKFCLQICVWKSYHHKIYHNQYIIQCIAYGVLCRIRYYISVMITKSMRMLVKPTMRVNLPQMWYITLIGLYFELNETHTNSFKYCHDCCITQTIIIHFHILDPIRSIKCVMKNSFIYKLFRNLWTKTNTLVHSGSNDNNVCVSHSLSLCVFLTCFCWHFTYWLSNYLIASQLNLSRLSTFFFSNSNKPQNYTILIISNEHYHYISVNIKRGKLKQWAIK